MYEIVTFNETYFIPGKEAAYCESDWVINAITANRFFGHTDLLNICSSNWVFIP